MKQAPGKGLLKVTGILFIIFGAVSVVVTLIGVFMGTFFVAAGMSVTGAVVVVGIIIMCLGGLLEFLAGIFGVKNCDKPEKCNTCIVYGVLIIALTLVGNLMNGFYWTSVFGYILPVLYFIGAIQNKSAAR